MWQAFACFELVPLASQLTATRDVATAVLSVVVVMCQVCGIGGLGVRLSGHDLI